MYTGNEAQAYMCIRHLFLFALDASMAGKHKTSARFDDLFDTARSFFSMCAVLAEISFCLASEQKVGDDATEDYCETVWSGRQ